MTSVRHVVGSLLLGLAVLGGTALHAFGQAKPKNGRKAARSTAQRQIVYDRVHSIPAGGYWQLPHYVQSGGGTQFGGFLVQDATSDVDAPIRSWIGLNPSPAQDVEVLIMEEPNFALFAAHPPLQRRQHLRPPPLRAVQRPPATRPLPNSDQQPLLAAHVAHTADARDG